MAWGGRNLKDHLVPSPLGSIATHYIRMSDLSQMSLNTFRNGEFTTSLCKPCTFLKIIFIFVLLLTVLPRAATENYILYRYKGPYKLFVVLENTCSKLEVNSLV